MIIREATEADVPAIVRLMAAGLGPGRLERSAATFRWKHLENPFGESDVLLAFDGDMLVGLRAFMRWRFSVGGRVVQAARAVDTVTHPEYRGRGIFRKLTLELLERLPDEVAFVFNTPNESSRPGYLKMGWRDVYRPAVWVRPRVGLGPEVQPRPGEAALRDPRIGPLLDARSAAPQLRTAWTKDALRWRFGRGSGLEYRVVSTEEELDAVAVYTLRDRRGRRELTLLELFVGPSPRAVRRAAGLLRALLRTERPIYGLALPDGRRVRAAIGLAGFVPVPGIGPRLVARSLPRKGPIPMDLFSARSWSPSAGTLELL